MIKGDEKIDFIKNTLGSQEKYLDIISKYKFTNDEKDILLQATANIMHPNIDKLLIYEAYEILASKIEASNKVLPTKKNTYTTVSKEKKEKTSIWTWIVLFLFIGYFFGEIGKKDVENSYENSSPSKYTTKSTTRRSGECNVTDFTIIQSSGYREGSYYKIPFSVTNNCSSPAGVKVQMSLYGKNNTLLGVFTGWPASINNIPAGETYNEEWLKRVEQDVYRVTFKAVDVKSW